MEEIWKPIKGYEGLYEVSNYGRVRSIGHYVTFSNGVVRYYSSTVLKPREVSGGYYDVILYKDKIGSHNRIHRLVAEQFIENPECLRDVNHKNENKKDNRAENLEWVTHSDNMLYGTRTQRWRKTMFDNGHISDKYSGLSVKEYRKKWWQEHKDTINEERRKRRQSVQK